MKPTDLFNAIENIPDKYIAAAKPSSVKRHGESRSVVQKSVRDAEAVRSKQSSLSDARDTHSRKDNIRMNTKQSVLQRIATAFAATAACAVFAGGGLIIVQQVRQNQQARQNQQDSDNFCVETARNFLGGSGDIRTTDDMFLMYDDQKFYFQYAEYAAMRSGSEIDTLQMREYLGDILYDGEQFFRKEGAEGTELYRIDMQGKHIDEKPFYTIDTDAVSAQLGSAVSAPMYHTVRKLADGYYYISYSVVLNNNETAYLKSKDYNIIYQPATGQQDEVPNGTVTNAQMNENNIIFNMPTPRMVTDGKDIIFAEFDGSMYRVTLDPVKIERYEPVPKAGSYTHDWMIADGSLYFMTGTGDSEDIDEDDAPYSYGKIDLASHTYTEILHEADFNRFYPCDGKVFALTDNNTKLVCADPDWTNVETVCDFRSGMTDAFTKALKETCGGDLTNAYITAADENYILVCFVFGDPGKTCAIIDRKTGAVRFFRSPETGDNTTEITAEQNLLGGTGTLHSAGDNWLIYDDSYVYLPYYTARGLRNPGEQISYLDPNWESAYPGMENLNLISDGRNIYRVDTFCVYTLDVLRWPEAVPFFTVPEKKIAAFKQEHGNAYVQNISIDRLTDQYYHIFVTLEDNPVSQAADAFRTYGYLYNADTTECKEIPDLGNGITWFRSYPYSDGFCCAPNGTDSLYRFDLDSYTFEQLPAPDPYIVWNECILVQNDTIYYLTPGENGGFSEPYYCKYDLKTKKSEIISKTPDFKHFVPFDGMIYASDLAGTQIVCYDAELKNKTVLADFERDVPAALKESAQNAVRQSDGPIVPIARVDCADENYVCAHLADGTDFLLNCQTGKLTFYPYTDSVQNDPQTAQNTDAEQNPGAEPANSADENVLGGWGRLHPVDWDVRGSVALLRDDINYYFFNSDGKWYSCPLAGGQKTQLPARIGGAQAPQNPFLSDGERVYTKDMIVVSEGTAVNSFDTAAIRAYLDELNDDATDNGYYYSCDNIWHIRNRYFLHIIGEKPGSNDISIELWTDDNGKIISHETAQTGTSRFFCNGYQTEMCAIRDGILDIIDCPGDEPGDKPDPLAYGKILDLYYDMDGSYFLSENCDLYTFDSQGQKALITNVPFNNPLLMTAPDGRFFYVNMERLNFSLREWNENGTDEEIYAPENSRSQELWICGYEQTGNNSYNIVLKHTYNEGETGFVFVNPTTGQIVKEIQ